MTLPLPPATPVAFTTPRLKDRAAHGAARFVPEYSEVFASIFTWWNALDALMATTADIPWQTGYVREVQVRRMVALVQEAFLEWPIRSHTLISPPCAHRVTAAHFTSSFCAREFVPAVTSTAPPALATTLSTSTAATALSDSC